MLDATGGTVDHYLSFTSRPELAYEWTNYRYASSILNSSKRTSEVLDPYRVGDGWFRILLPSLQLEMTPKVPEELRELANHTLKQLHLRDGERIIRWRRAWYKMYLDKKLTLEGLEDVAPLIAEAVRAQAEERSRSSPRTAKKTAKKVRSPRAR